MAVAPPVFVTQYEVLRTQDYVLITLSAPTGEVVGGTMQIQEVQRVALTIPRFLEMVGALSQIARNIETGAQPSKPKPQREPRKGFEDEDRPREPEPRDWVIKH